MRILLTGATGFLGSHIADYLYNNGFELMLTRRHMSVLDKCSLFEKSVKWVYVDDKNWVNTAIKFNPGIIIHAAWNGVENSKRDDWEVQLSNIDFLYQLLKIAKETKIKKFISLGSQAEYGQFNVKVTEDYKVNPVGTYGMIKLACLEYLKSFCNDNSIQWYWLRIFSILGKNDNPTWLIPSVVERLKRNEEIELTLGDQCYDYMYINDFVERLRCIIISEKNNSGIFNICTGRPVPIKELLVAVANKTGKPLSLLKFGVQPYRPNQTMYMVGDPTKYELEFGKSHTTSIEALIDKLI